MVNGGALLAALLAGAVPATATVGTPVVSQRRSVLRHVADVAVSRLPTCPELVSRTSVAIRAGPTATATVRGASRAVARSLPVDPQDTRVDERGRVRNQTVQAYAAVCRLGRFWSGSAFCV